MWIFVCIRPCPTKLNSLIHTHRAFTYLLVNISCGLGFNDFGRETEKMKLLWTHLLLHMRQVYILT